MNAPLMQSPAARAYILNQDPVRQQGLALGAGPGNQTGQEAGQDQESNRSYNIIVNHAEEKSEETCQRYTAAEKSEETSHG